jgi:thiol-disulfide isomerase/thioredoxin
MRLDDVKSKFTKTVGNKKFFIIMVVTVIFLIAALYSYKRFVSDRMNKNYVTNSEFESTGDKTAEYVDIYFFHTTWCPHCKTAMPIWNSFKGDLENKKINGMKINFYEVDCDKDTETADKFNVKGFPTIKLVRGNQVVEYDAKPDKKTLMEFVTTSTA